ncbi:hypothetical protein HYX01_00140 [Candidatus Woesearchaeota archaeon]|nr:hypothetical protein [Candidatus Woesearchaeota archaeon]
MKNIKNMLLKNIFAFLMLFLLAAAIAFAHDEENFAETKRLIDSKIQCDKLTDEQLRHIGDYYMEQMHPGEAHELMDQMMGGEASESLRQTHILMAKRLYCKDTSGMTNYGMMGMMGGMMNMAMGSGMMGNYGYGMMGNFGYSSGYWGFVNILSVLLAIGLVILVYLWIIKLWKDIQGKNIKK